MNPYQVRLDITYDGTAPAPASEAPAGSGAGASGGAAMAASVPAGCGASYTVVKGDCLWGIASRFLGSGARYMEIYNANVDVIESTARAHGKPNASKGSTKGWWIWAGEVFTIPGVGSQQEQLPPATAPAPPKRIGASNPALGKKMADQATAFTYDDVASGKSDSISISLQDIEKEWIGKLMPQRGASIGAKIVLDNYNNGGTEVFDCGTFVLDDISFSGRPLNGSFGGVSVPAMDDFKSLPKTRTWEKTTIQDIASKIAAEAGIALYYEADTVQIAEIEQNKQTDSAFLYNLCEKYGVAMKVYNQKIVIFDIIKYEEKPAVCDIDERDMLSGWSYNTTVDGTYTGVSLNYTDPDSDESINVTMGSEGRMYAINTQASSQFDAELQAAAKVNEANRGIETMKVPIRPNLKLVASHCVNITGLERINGKYYIDQVRHSAGSSGYTMTLTLHKVQAAIKVTAPAAASTSGGGGKSYTVVSGDTLWGIAKQFYGSGTKYSVIYNANAETIEAAAKSHGKKSSDNGHWIYAGTTLTIPEV